MLLLEKDDRRLLFELDANSRTPFSQLGRSLKIPQETVRYRVKRLTELGVIHSFITAIDCSRLGWALYKVVLKLQSAGEPAVQSILDYLAADSSVAWLVRFEGSYDIGMAIWVSDIVDLSDFLDKLTSRFNQFISSRLLSVNIRGEFLPRDYLVRDRRKSTGPSTKHYGAEQHTTDLDPINEKILRLISANSRISAVDIERGLRTTKDANLPISPEAVLRRIKRLEADNIITGYSLVLNLPAIEQLHFKVLLYLNNLNLEEQAALIKTCRSHPRVVFLVKALGEWDYELDLNVENFSQYREIIMQITSAHPRAIRDYDALVVTQIRKYNLFP